MSDHRALEDLVQELNDKLMEANALVEKLRRKRYWKWTLDRVVVDVLEISPKPMAKWEIAREMERGGYEFRTLEPSKSVGVTLSNLQNAGRVEKVSEGHGGEWGPVDAMWAVPKT